MPDPDMTDVLPVTHVHDPDDRDDDVLDEGWDAPPGRTSKLTLLLVAGVVVALGFGAGVLVQKSHDSALLGGAARGRPAAETGRGTPSGRGQGGDQPRVVAGTVAAVSATGLTVTDEGGAAVAVTVPGTATVSTSGLGHPKVGDPVSVAGTKGPDGAVTATSVTVRADGP